MLNSAPVYQSLTSPAMVMGLPQTVFIILMGAMLIFAGAADFNLIALGIIVTMFLVARPFLRKLFENEPLALELMQSYFRWPTSLPHHGRVNRQPTSDPVPKCVYH